jgi:dTDP-4-amino-4,6-dideoxygalactose transaminase
MNVNLFNEHQMNRMEIAQKYLDSFAPLEAQGLIELPYGFAESGKPIRNHTYHLFGIKLLKNDVQTVINHMKLMGVGCTVAYGNLVSDYIMGDDDADREYPVARKMTESIIALPISQFMDLGMATTVINSFIRCLE